MRYLGYRYQCVSRGRNECDGCKVFKGAQLDTSWPKPTKQEQGGMRTGESGKLNAHSKVFLQWVDFFKMFRAPKCTSALLRKSEHYFHISPGLLVVHCEHTC